jgi:hypothetical protein
MNLLNKIILLVMLTGIFSPAFAAVDGADFTACSVFSDDDGGKKDGGKKEGEEEPDCE